MDLGVKGGWVKGEGWVWVSGFRGEGWVGKG